MFVLLVEAAVAAKQKDGMWGRDAYYLAENGEHAWSDLAWDMAREAMDLGYLNHEVYERSLDREAALEVAGFEAESWGLNSRGKSERASKVLGWRAKEKSLKDEVPTIVKAEYESVA